MTVTTLATATNSGATMDGWQGVIIAFITAYFGYLTVKGKRQADADKVPADAAQVSADFRELAEMSGKIIEELRHQVGEVKGELASLRSEFGTLEIKYRGSLRSLREYRREHPTTVVVIDPEVLRDL
ncbi:hypothetical protein [Corynebacterium doosanense]|nr:hypothetical protein [Corynebacterium doosanense]